MLSTERGRGKSADNECRYPRTWPIAASSPHRHGPDRPGITSTLTGILDESHARLIDIDQVVVRGVLTLCMVIEPHAEEVDIEGALVRGEGARRRARLRSPSPTIPCACPASATSSRSSATTSKRRTCSTSRRSWRPSAQTSSASRACRRARCPRSRSCSSSPQAADRERAPAAARDLHATRLSIALQREGLYRRAKRLVVMDMDSTLIRIEVIDELARAHGVVDAVSKITEAAMEESSTTTSRRVRRDARRPRREGRAQPRRELAAHRRRETLIEVLKRLGYRIAVISGGFSMPPKALKKRLDLDYAYSNTLEIKNGKLTGRVIGPLVNAQRKAELLETIAQAELAARSSHRHRRQDERHPHARKNRPRHRVPREAKATRSGRPAITASGLDAILYLLGLSARELRQVRDQHAPAGSSPDA